jgi:hypothetical protein
MERIGDMAMTARDVIMQVLTELPDHRVDQLLDYARYLTWQEEHREWQRFGQFQFARAYGDDEPEYTEADLRKDRSR